MDTPAKLEALRELMQAQGVAAFIVYSADPHMSEYLPTEWKEREWISNFTGSAGLVAITQDKAGLWTDSRYFVQAAAELKETGILLFKQGIEGVPSYVDWLKMELKGESVVAINGLCCAHDDWKRLEKEFGAKNIRLTDLSLLEELWKNRFVSQVTPIFIHKMQYAGQSTRDKLAVIRKKMAEKNTSLHLVSSLDDIAWLLNLRGGDVAFNPVFLSYLIVSENNARLFVDTRKCNAEVKNHLIETGVTLEEYDDFLGCLEKLQHENIWISAHSNQTIIKILQDKNTFYFAEPPSQLLKSVKNPTEIAGMRSAMVKDGVALVRFLYWLQQNVGRIPIDECEVGQKLLAFRAEQKDFQGASFETIAGYNENGAIVHYSAKQGKAKQLRAEGVLLLDSGGQYLEGTTDITRTIPLGEMSETFQKDYTLVLKGMIALSLAKFPKGTRGCNLDAIARQPLWQNARNYGHGTGHGVGCFLNVHEGPQSIRQELKEQILLPGMITSNEPGLYREGEYGIRHENLILCLENTTSDFGTFYEHETLTLCPFFAEPILKELLSKEEIDWFNNYQKKVLDILSPYLDSEHKEWLREVCKAI